MFVPAGRCKDLICPEGGSDGSFAPPLRSRSPTASYPKSGRRRVLAALHQTACELNLVQAGSASPQLGHGNDGVEHGRADAALRGEGKRHAHQRVNFHCPPA